jgi:probable HAF family extracellular repeat protein
MVERFSCSAGDAQEVAMIARCVSSGLFGKAWRSGAAAAFVCAAQSAAFGQLYQFQNLGELPGGATGSFGGGISSDGTVIVGSSWSNFQFPNDNALVTFRWNRLQGMQPLRDLNNRNIPVNANDASRDGTFICGDRYDNQAFIWTRAGGSIGLGYLGGNSFIQSSAAAISADGTVVVGYSGLSQQTSRAFRWTQATGMVSLGTLSGQSTASSFANDISGNGQVIVGESDSNIGRQAFRWTQFARMEGLGDLPGGAVNSSAIATNTDGVIIVGRGTTAEGQVAFRWVQGQGMRSLGDLPGGTVNSEARGVSADGRVVIGLSSSASGLEGFIWDAGRGMRSLRDLLIRRGVSEAANWTSLWTNAISDDGRVIVCTGDNGQGLYFAIRVEIPAVCEADFNDDGVLDFFDYLDFVAAYATESPRADFNFDGTVDFFDYLDFVAGFDTGCA